MAADAPYTDMNTRRVDTGRIVLNVREAGSGPLMLFFHGITANSATLAPLAARFGDRFTTVAVDQRAGPDQRSAGPRDHRSRTVRNPANRDS